MGKGRWSKYSVTSSMTKIRNPIDNINRRIVGNTLPTIAWSDRRFDDLNQIVGKPLSMITGTRNFAVSFRATSFCIIVLPGSTHSGIVDSSLFMGRDSLINDIQKKLPFIQRTFFTALLSDKSQHGRVDYFFFIRTVGGGLLSSKNEIHHYTIATVWQYNCNKKIAMNWQFTRRTIWLYFYES